LTSALTTFLAESYRIVCGYVRAVEWNSGRNDRAGAKLAFVFPYSLESSRS
jgi:hypothetical protein